MQNENTSKTALRYGAFGLLGVGALFLGKRFLQAFKKDNAESELATDESAQNAQAFRAAFNTSGNSWMIAFDGTDTPKVFALASQVKDFPKVQQYYRDLYKSSLTEDLGSELSADDLAKFWAIMNGKKALADKTNKANKAIQAGNFKFKIGDKLVSKPLKGNTKIGYGTIIKNVLKIVAWHTFPGAYVGTITGFKKVKVKDYDGVSRWLSGYYIKDIPNGEKFGVKNIFVLEREVAKQN